MKGLLTATVAFATTTAISYAAIADDLSRMDKMTIAVFGDWPYNQNLLTNAPLLINSVNADPDVRLVIHVGDIHSGSQPCTSADILPPISTADPNWSRQVYFQFQQFKKPVVYTPGDNEWTDCHKTKEFKAGAPLKELAAVRQLFFARPGKTLGLEDKDVFSQSRYFDEEFPGDEQFVENVIWQDGKVVFATLNLPGSNNDTLAWTNGFEDPAAHAQEVANRTAADIRWLKTAFRLAKSNQAKAVVLAVQADMWDPAAVAPGGDGLSAYTPLVQELANQCLQFGRPVLLLNGDSHLFEADHPLANPSSPQGLIHRTLPVPNLTRIIVQGSTNAPAEWLRLTIDTTKANVFSWANIPYCKDPLASCQ